MPESSDDTAEQGSEPASETAGEIARLRALVGPSEESYERLRADVAEARQAAKQAEAEAGQLRGLMAEMSTQLARARQDQDRLQRPSNYGWRAAYARVKRMRPGSR
jgi:chromosome segregation ATPase